ncbi:transporter [Polymorphobacter arshaanensis]|uniref:Transporter n=1 Tax=Glacieibacterium arshaanense TaxID=2511025 RepID=A0A4Y9ETM1_9SPHN|nr:transporter [Polymorphobacter arshaanensis]
MGAITLTAPACAEGVPAATAEEEAAKLAKQLSNPVADLISVPFQGNWDSGGGPDGKGSKYWVNIQPVVPIHLNDDWNLISRTILPFITQSHITPGPATGQTGFGDTTQSFFLSPTKGGLIWGVGPVILVPTSTSPGLGGAKWSIGPTGVALKQSGPWTIGVLANQMWSFAGNARQADVDALYVQPFLTYTTRHFTTVILNSETTCNWKLQGNQCAVPINLDVAQLMKIGGQRVQFGAGGRYYVSRPEGTAEWGIRAFATFLFPTGKK